MKRSTMIELLVLLIIFLGLSGCIGYQSFPLAARTGDTITLALGGSPSHELIPGGQITLNDLTIKIQQDINGNSVIDSNETFTVTKRYLFRIYPDQTSKAANSMDGGAYPNPVGLWTAVLDLADPITHNPLPLVGNRQATVVVTTSKLRNNLWGGSEGFINSTPITILTGTGQSHNFNNASGYADVSMLQPLPQLALGFSGSGDVAAVVLDIDYDETVLRTSFGGVIKIRQDITTPDVILNQRIYSDNGNMKIRILLTTNQWNWPVDMLKCFIVWNKNAVVPGKTVTTNTFNVTSAKFYDETGAEVTGITVVKTLLYQ